MGAGLWECDRRDLNYTLPRLQLRRKKSDANDAQLSTESTLRQKHREIDIPRRVTEARQ